LHNPNCSDADWEADNDSDKALDNSIKNGATLQLKEVSAALNVPGVIQQMQQSNTVAEQVLIMVNPWKMKRNKGNNTM